MILILQYRVNIILRIITSPNLQQKRNVGYDIGQTSFASYGICHPYLSVYWYSGIIFCVDLGLKGSNIEANLLRYYRSYEMHPHAKSNMSYQKI
jgi:hypothetical protein